MCGQACAWFIETGDEKMHPKNRSDFVRNVYNRYNTFTGKVKGALGLMKTPTLEDIKENMGVYWACTVCGRCTLSCPIGISNRRLYRGFRIAYTEAGISETNPTLKAIIDNSRDKKHSFGLSNEDVVAKPGLFLQYEGCEMPLDIPGAEYLFVCPAAGNTKIPELGIKGMKIMNAAGLDYTVSSKIIDTGTEIDHVAAHEGISKQMLLDWEEEAERLGVQTVIVAECGCDVRTMYVEATEILGRPFKFPIISIDSMWEDIVNEHAVPFEPINESVTMHDPCYVTRMSGMGEKYRKIMPKIVKDFREMTPNMEQNYCCNGGAGGMRMPENTERRRKISRLKANQIENTGAEIVATPCAICYLNMKDITEFYKQATPENRKARMFFEIFYDAMMKGLEKNSQTDLVKMPKLLKNMDKSTYKKHSIEGFMEDLKKNKKTVFVELLKKYRNDPNVLNYARENPGFWGYFDKVEKEVQSA
jgi:Fe-S oxidoreductase